MNKGVKFKSCGVVVSALAKNKAQKGHLGGLVGWACAFGSSCDSGPWDQA